MKYQEFLTVIMFYKKFDEEISKLYNFGFDLREGKFNLSHYMEKILEVSMLSHYTREGFDWISWFIYESDYGQKDWSLLPSLGIKEDGTSGIVHKAGEVRFGAHDSEGNPICHSYKSLWEYLEKECKHK